MSGTATVEPASVVSVWRYPVKSMIGEELNVSDVTERGLLGDRAHALVDRSTGKVASTKNPRKWARLFDCRAAFVAPPSATERLPEVRIILPDGTSVTSEQSDVDHILARVFGREATLATTPPDSPGLEEYGRISKAWRTMT